MLLNYYKYININTWGTAGLGESVLSLRDFSKEISMKQFKK